MTEVIFTSPISNLKVWIDMTYIEWVNNRPRPVQGKKVEFKEGILKLDSEKDADTIDFLRHHPVNNSARGFYEDIATRPKEFWPEELLQETEEEPKEEDDEEDETYLVEEKPKVKTKRK